MTEDDLNELVHAVSDLLDAATDQKCDRMEINDILSAYLENKAISVRE